VSPEELERRIADIYDPIASEILEAYGEALAGIDYGSGSDSGLAEAVALLSVVLAGAAGKARGAAPALAALYAKYVTTYDPATASLTPGQASRIKALALETAGTMGNLVMSSAVSESFVAAAGRAYMRVHAGLDTPMRAAWAEAKRAAAAGIDTVRYPSGRTDRVDVALRRSVVSTANRLAAEAALEAGDRLGMDHYDVSWHNGARPEHALWQGKRYTRMELETVCGMGSVTGLGGVNCMHTIHPVRAGAPQQSQKGRMSDEEGAKLYADAQRMRSIERRLREVSRLQTLAKGNPEAAADAKRLKERKRSLMREYSEIAKRSGLKEEFERAYVH
jgi:hypothetical protein